MSRGRSLPSANGGSRPRVAADAGSRQTSGNRVRTTGRPVRLARGVVAGPARRESRRPPGPQAPPWSASAHTRIEPGTTRDTCVAAAESEDEHGRGRPASHGRSLAVANARPEAGPTETQIVRRCDSIRPRERATAAVSSLRRAGVVFCNVAHRLGGEPRSRALAFVCHARPRPALRAKSRQPASSWLSSHEPPSFAGKSDDRTAPSHQRLVGDCEPSVIAPGSCPTVAVGRMTKQRRAAGRQRDIPGETDKDTPEIPSRPRFESAGRIKSRRFARIHRRARCGAGDEHSRSRR